MGISMYVFSGLQSWEHWMKQCMWKYLLKKKKENQYSHIKCSHSSQAGHGAHGQLPSTSYHKQWVCKLLPSPKNPHPNPQTESFLFSYRFWVNVIYLAHLMQTTSQIKEDGFGRNVRMSRNQWKQRGGIHHQILSLQLHSSLIMLLYINFM